MPTPSAKHILIAPLDWGLGHTTRCIPIIRYLQDRGHKVTFAGNEAQQKLILQNVSNISTALLDGYNVTYTRYKSSFLLNILKQLPRLTRHVKNEHQWLKHFAAKAIPDGIISDNRYGLYHATIPSILLTHQPGLKTGLGAVADAIARRLHYYFLAKFSEVWLVDHSGENNLSGQLAHPSTLPPRSRYIGLLSQMLPAKKAIQEDHLMVLLSGPEPQRTMLQDILWEEVKAHHGKVLFIAGSVTAGIPEMIPPHITYHQQLPAASLQPLLESATYVICRSGYTTLMDLAALGKKALLIPTPGQTEQEYLAKHLNGQGIFPMFKQQGFSLANALNKASGFPFKPLAIAGANQEINEVLKNWLDTL